MPRDLLGHNISTSLDDEFDLEDPNMVGKDMEIVENTSIAVIKQKAVEVNPKDALEDYAITRVTLQETLEQSREILKTAAELLKDNPNPNTLKVIPSLILAINQTTDSLFNIHIKISNQVKKQTGTKVEVKESEGLTTKDFIRKHKRDI